MDKENTPAAETAAEEKPQSPPVPEVKGSQLHPWPKGEIGIIEAIANVSANIGEVGKDKKNKDQNFMYRSIDAIMTAVHASFAEQKIVITNRHVEGRTQTRKTRSGSNMYYKEKEHTFTFWYIDGSSLETTVTGTSQDMGDKADNKCLSIALKYALTTLLLVPLATDDPDKNSEDTMNPPAEKPSTAKQQAAIKAAWKKYRAVFVENNTDYKIEQAEEKCKAIMLRDYKVDAVEKLWIKQASKFLDSLKKKTNEAIEKRGSSDDKGKEKDGKKSEAKTKTPTKGKSEPTKGSTPTPPAAPEPDLPAKTQDPSDDPGTDEPAAENVGKE